MQKFSKYLLYKLVGFWLQNRALIGLKDSYPLICLLDKTLSIEKLNTIFSFRALLTFFIWSQCLTHHVLKRKRRDHFFCRTMTASLKGNKLNHHFSPYVIIKMKEVHLSKGLEPFGTYCVNSSQILHIHKK